MNEIYQYLLLIAILGIGSVWITAVFFFILYVLGVYED